MNGDRQLVLEHSRTTILVIFIVLLTCAVYSPVLQQQFVDWDDSKHVLAVWKPGLERAWNIISDFKLKFTGTAYYSPLFFLSLMSDQLAVIGGNHPEAWPAKLMNVVYHLLNVLLVLKLLLMTGLNRRSAFIGAALFAVHPLQAGSVAWISERKNLLSTFFYLCGLLVFIGYYQTGRKRSLVLLPIVFIAGVLSKPSVVTLPVALAGWVFFVPHEKQYDRSAFRVIALLFALALGWGIFVVSTEVSYPGILPPWYYRPLLAAGAIWFYLAKLVYPLNLCPIYPRWEVQENLPIFLGFFGGLLLIGGGIIGYRKHFQSASLWGCFFFLLNLLPVIGLVPFGYMGHSYVADHFVYLSMVGVAFVVSHGIQTILSRTHDYPVLSRLVFPLALTCVTMWGVLAHRQTGIWHDGDTLWSYTLEKNDQAVAAYNNYGRFQMMRGKAGEALELFRKASELAPNFEAPYNNMGDAYRAMGEDEQATNMYDRAIRLNEKAVYPRLMKAGMMKQRGKQDEAIAYLRKCVARLPESAVLRNELGVAYHQAGKNGEALAEFDEAIKLAGTLFSEPLVHKATILLGRGEAEESVGLLERAIGLGFVKADTYNVLGAAYAARGERGLALKSFLAAYESKPALPGVRDNVANAYMDLGDYRAADDFCVQAARSGAPCSEETWSRLETEASTTKR